MLEMGLYASALTVLGLPIACLSLFYLVCYVLEEKIPSLTKAKQFCKDSCINLFFLLLICCFGLILYEVFTMLYDFVQAVLK